MRRSRLKRSDYTFSTTASRTRSRDILRPRCSETTRRSPSSCCRSAPVRGPERGRLQPRGGPSEGHVLPRSMTPSCTAADAAGSSSAIFCHGIRKIIHVRRHGNSSVLSHLFAQGVVSGELLVKTTRNSARNSNVAGCRPTFAFLIRNRVPRPTSTRVVYGIVSKSQRPIELPFFSKVILRDARRRLMGYGYNVTLKKISRAAGP